MTHYWLRIIAHTAHSLEGRIPVCRKATHMHSPEFGAEGSCWKLWRSPGWPKIWGLRSAAALQDGQVCLYIPESWAAAPEGRQNCKGRWSPGYIWVAARGSKSISRWGWGQPPFWSSHTGKIPTLRKSIMHDILQGVGSLTMIGRLLQSPLDLRVLPSLMLLSEILFFGVSLVIYVLNLQTLSWCWGTCPSNIQCTRLMSLEGPEIGCCLAIISSPFSFFPSPFRSISRTKRGRGSREESKNL